MLRNSSRLTPSYSSELSKGHQLGKNQEPLHGNAYAFSTAKSSPTDQRFVHGSRDRSTLPSWVHSRGPAISAKLLKTEPEQLTTSEDYLTCTEVAAVLRVSLRTVRRLIAAGRIPHIRIGRQVRIPREELMNYGARKNDKYQWGVGLS